jgi:SAM-dependent methyltransferase
MNQNDESGSSSNPEPYWSRVAIDIRKRGPDNYVAGDDNPFYRYKRRKFLARFLGSIDFDSKVVLEVGPGPGGNLLQIIRAGAKRVIGIDISKQMLDLAAETLRGQETNVQLLKTDGEHLPLANNSANLTLTVTVLQHNTDTSMFQRLIGEICRVTEGTVVLIEDTSNGAVVPSGSAVARPVSIYEAECRKHGFRLADCEHLGLRASRKAYNLVNRLLISPDHLEGKPFGVLPVFAMRVLLTFTRLLDDVVSDNQDLTKMVFVRDSEA